jgi:hypothetical protein
MVVSLLPNKDDNDMRRVVEASKQSHEVDQARQQSKMPSTFDHV